MREHQHQPTPSQIARIQREMDEQIALGNFVKCVTPGCGNIFVNNPKEQWPVGTRCPRCGALKPEMQ